MYHRIPFRHTNKQIQMLKSTHTWLKDKTFPVSHFSVHFRYEFVHRCSHPRTKTPTNGSLWKEGVRERIPATNNI